MERLTASRCKAIGDSLRRFDLTTANAITAHADWLKEAELALREACIQLAASSSSAASTSCSVSFGRAELKVLYEDSTLPSLLLLTEVMA